jgi:hypothetical protein
MKMVSKVSEITTADIAKYIRLDDYDESELATYLNIAKSYISNYTGILAEGEGETLDDFADFVIVVYVLCQDMYDNRAMYVDGSNINKVVQTILDMHTRNNL